jgi:DNA gyrase/topoisomerase IV subunit A
VSYRYEHKKEVDEALEIAMKDISVMDKIIEIIKGDGKDEEKARAIMKVVKVAMIIFE